jgi:hypothetical protein
MGLSSAFWLRRIAQSLPRRFAVLNEVFFSPLNGTPPCSTTMFPAISLEDAASSNPCPLRLQLFAFGVPPSCLATLRLTTIHVRPCALSPFSFKCSKLLLSLRRFSLSPALPSTLCVSTPFGSIVPIILDLFATLRFAAIHPLQKCSHQFSDPSVRRHRPRLAPLPLDSEASHAPIGGSIQQSYCIQSYHALSSVISDVPRWVFPTL